ncbi:MAG: hypothetical protein U0002_07355 [Thermoanaerobaculia bacterium]
MRTRSGLKLACLTLSLLAARPLVAAEMVPIGLNRPLGPAGLIAESAVAAEDDGSTHQLYLPLRNDFSHAGVWTRTFARNGRVLSGAAQISSSATAHDLSLALDPTGGTFGVWAEPASGSTRSRILGYRSSTGETSVLATAARQAEVTSSVLSCQPAVGCVLTWYEYTTSSPSPTGPSEVGDVKARRLDAGGNPVGGVINVTPATLHGVPRVRVALADDGRFAISWQALRTQPLPGGYALLSAPAGRLFDDQGHALASLAFAGYDLSSDTAASAPALAWNGDGILQAVWGVSGPSGSSNRRLYTSRFNEQGQSASQTFKIDSTFPESADVAWQKRVDRFVLVWSRTSGPATPESQTQQIQSLRLGADGRPGQPPVLVTEGSFPPATEDGSAGIHALRIAAVGQDTVKTYWLRQPRLASASQLLSQELFLGGSPCIGFPPVPCAPLQTNQRFIAWINYRDGSGVQYLAPPVGLTPDTSGFTFTSADVPEVVVKVLDGSGLNGKFWVFFASLTDQEFSLVVEDRVTGAARAYYNPAGRLASAADTSAFNAGSQAAADRLEEQSLELPAGPVEPRQTSACTPSQTRLCLADGMFFVEVDWQDFNGGSGTGRPVPATASGGYFTFFDPNNIELAVKLLDGTSLNGHYWVFYASLTSVEFTLRVRDAAGNVVATYHNPSGNMASVADVQAF